MCSLSTFLLEKSMEKNTLIGGKCPGDYDTRPKAETKATAYHEAGDPGKGLNALGYDAGGGEDG
jgi:hypothetical protein